MVAQSKLIIKLITLLRNIGQRFTDRLWRLGAGVRLFALILISSGESFRRFRLVTREIYSTGVLSLIIILVSAFFVGIIKRAWPCYHCATVRRARWHGNHGRNWPYENNRTIISYGNDGCKPCCASVCTAFLGWCNCHAHFGHFIFNGGYFRWIFSGCTVNWGRRRGILVTNAICS